MKNENCPNCNRLLNERTIDWVNGKCPFCDLIEVEETKELETFLSYEDFVNFLEIFCDVDEFEDDKTGYNYLRNFEEHYQNCLTPNENYNNLLEFIKG